MSRLNRTETTTKNCKRKKVKTAYARGNRKNLGNYVVSPEEENERLQWEGFEEKEVFKSGMKETMGDEKLIIITGEEFRADALRGPTVS